MLRLIVFSFIFFLFSSINPVFTSEFVEVEVEGHETIEFQDAEYNFLYNKRSRDEILSDIYINGEPLSNESKKEPTIEEIVGDQKQIEKFVDSLLLKHNISFSKRTYSEYQVVLYKLKIKDYGFITEVGAEFFYKNQIEGSLVGLDNSIIKTYETKLTNKLLEKAQLKADSVAKKTKKRIRQIISVKDKEEPSMGWVEYPPLSSQKIKRYDIKTTIKKTFLVRFQVENIK